MNPSYFRLKLPLEEALARVAEWWGTSIPAKTPQIDSMKAVKLACDENGNWTGGALFYYESSGWSVFEDLTGGFGFTPAEDWLQLARDCALVVAGYNDAIATAELIVIEEGQVLREFAFDRSLPEENIDRGRLPIEESLPIQSWVQVASFVDADHVVAGIEGWLWLSTEGDRQAAPWSPKSTV